MVAVMLMWFAGNVKGEGRREPALRLRQLIVALWLFFFLSPRLQGSYALGQEGALRRLAVGESVTFCVEAARLNNASGICLEAGGHYQFAVTPGEVWFDAKICCDASGWTASEARAVLRPLIRAAEPKRRCPEANWFELIGQVDGGECFRIGCRGAGWTYSPSKDGQLLAFANDVVQRYGNNRGSIRLTVTRVGAPAAALPGCF